MKKAYLVLENGQYFEGIRFGADVDCIGELVFTTGVGGYTETLTDPAAYGQIIMNTFPLIGNYGVCEEDFEGRCIAAGCVVRSWCDTPSNFRSEYDFDTFLKKNGVPGICGIDTRCITRILRENGTMNAAILSEVSDSFEHIMTYKAENALQAAARQQTETFEAQNEKARVCLIDLGAKKSFISSLTDRGCTVISVAPTVSAEEILALSPDGIVVSNGPGDPNDYVFQTEQIAKLLCKVPMLGICLGHHLIALADGGRSVRLSFGHHGENQPCRETSSGRIYITCQSHGFAVEADSTRHGVVSFVNANDGSCEGISYPELRAEGVQFSPEGHAGPRDTEFILDRFVASIGGEH